MQSLKYLVEGFWVAFDCCRGGSWKERSHSYCHRELHGRWDGEGAVGKTQTAAGQETRDKPKQKKHLHGSTFQPLHLLMMNKGKLHNTCTVQKWLKARALLTGCIWVAVSQHWEMWASGPMLYDSVSLGTVPHYFLLVKLNNNTDWSIGTQGVAAVAY